MTLSDVGEGGVKYSKKCSDVICGWSLGIVKTFMSSIKARKKLFIKIQSNKIKCTISVLKIFKEGLYSVGFPAYGKKAPLKHA